MTDVSYQDSGLYVCQISTHPPKELHTKVMVKGKQLVKENASKDLFVCTITLRMPNVENT